MFLPGKQGCSLLSSKWNFSHCYSKDKESVSTPSALVLVTGILTLISHAPRSHAGSTTHYFSLLDSASVYMDHLSMITDSPSAAPESFVLAFIFSSLSETIWWMCPRQTVLAGIFHYTETTFQPLIQLECQGHESSQAYLCTQWLITEASSAALLLLDLR